MVGYSINLASISLEEFAETLLTVELLPSRKMLADHIAAVVPKLMAQGVADLGGLRKLLANRGRYDELANQLGVAVDYLTVLNREVNSYVSKPVALTKLELLSDDELGELRSIGIKSTKELYERVAARDARVAVQQETEIDMARLEYALGLANLIRINGVGPAFADYLLAAGIRGPQDFLGRDLHEMVADYAAKVSEGPKLRIEDLEYVQRYCRGLTEDIEW